MSYRNIRLRNQLNDLMQSKKLTDIRLQKSITNPFERLFLNPSLWADLVKEVDSDLESGVEIELSESEEEKYKSDCMECFGEYLEEHE